MTDTIIFDLDGTLLNTLEDLADSVNHIMKLHGFPERTLDEIRSFIGNGVPTLIRRSLPSGTDEKTAEICSKYKFVCSAINLAIVVFPHPGGP